MRVTSELAAASVLFVAAEAAVAGDNLCGPSVRVVYAR